MTKRSAGSPTLGQCRDEVASRFASAGLCYGHGTDNAGDEAAWLVLYAAGIAPADFDGDWSRPFDEAQMREAWQLASLRISTRKPLAYLIREAWFAGLRMFVDERVIVPRSHIGEWLRNGLRPWVQPGQVRAALDVGCGSGCIAIALALAFPGARVDAVDVSSQALEVADINVRHHGVSDRVRLLQGDLFSSVDPGVLYDLIVSNPPYVSAKTMASLPPEYGHEPTLALAGGASGLDMVGRLLVGARRHLTGQGMLVVEAGSASPALEQRLGRVPFMWLSSEAGDDSGVFLLSGYDLNRHRADLDAAFGASTDPRQSEVG